MSKVIYLILEGDDEIRFFDKIISPLFLKCNCFTTPYKQSKRKKKSCGQFIQAVEKIESWDYLYARDIDVFPCARSRKEYIMRELSNKIKEDKIIIVAKVIEGWYLAGASEKTMRSLGVTPRDIRKITRSTDNIDKAQFIEYFPSSRAHIVIMNMLLDNYDIETAKQRNRSFNYFISKFIYKILN